MMTNTADTTWLVSAVFACPHTVSYTHLVQLFGKILPAGVPGAGQGDELAGQVDPPAAVCGGKLIIDGFRLVLQLSLIHIFSAIL